MEFDPVNRDAPAPRYELESAGSEDEFEQEIDAGKSQSSYTLVKTGKSSSLEEGSQLLVLVNNAGTALLSSLDGRALAQRYSIQMESEQHASIAVVASASCSNITVALVAPLPHVSSSSFHDLAHTLVEATKPSSIVVVDSYSQEQQLYRSPCADDEPGRDAAIKYLATPSYLAQHKLDRKVLEPLRSPESAGGLGAAFLSKAVVDNTPAILTLLEDVSFQSHVQLYGSLGASRLAPAASKALTALTGLDSTTTSSTGDATRKETTLLDFVASRRIKPAANLAVLGDGNMYI